ncbi:MAG: ribbon-helix-helix domain-containing protein [Dehalococcoidia bacterium]|nr:ribbon-helix-helix domain-containing protein [Dehalococcoidia bacterium]
MRKVMITLPQEFLDEMDRFAQHEHRNRSEFIREAVRHYMARGEKKAESRHESVRHALLVQEEARNRTRNVSFDSTGFIREWREGSARPNP